MNHESFRRQVLEDAKRYAIAQYPKEMCGFITDLGFIPAPNSAVDPIKDFRIDPEEYLKVQSKMKILAILHSHTNGRAFPTEIDMRSQLNTNVPWGIILTDGFAADDPVMWGDSLPIAPLIGRQFMHGVWDCYSLVRDTFRLGKEQLAELDVTQRWPFEPVTFPEFPRSDAWWDGPDDLYVQNFGSVGFDVIERDQARVGDCMLMRIGSSKKLSHAAILIDQDLILHHLPTRLSRREPSGIWARHADVWVRFKRL